MFIYAGDTIKYANGMIGTVTKSGLIALVGRNGHAISVYPKFDDYDHEIITISRSLPNKDEKREMTKYRTLFDANNPWYDHVQTFQLRLDVDREEAEASQTDLIGRSLHGELSQEEIQAIHAHNAESERQAMAA